MQQGSSPSMAMGTGAVVARGLHSTGGTGGLTTFCTTTMRSSILIHASTDASPMAVARA